MDQAPEARYLAAVGDPYGVAVIVVTDASYLFHFILFFNLFFGIFVGGALMGLVLI